ncbi:MAG: helix-turn-helix domain-containing protein [Myxococcaceae bacterium]|nr:helix-turn-helix domain-containing protein [Myxococcaceae bacterium]
MAKPTRAKTFIEYAGAQVRRHRLRVGLTQEKLAEQCDFVPRYIQRIEAGKVDMPISTVVRLADALGVPPVSLFRPATSPKRVLGRPIKKAREAFR